MPCFVVTVVVVVVVVVVVGESLIMTLTCTVNKHTLYPNSYACR